MAADAENGTFLPANVATDYEGIILDKNPTFQPIHHDMAGQERNAITLRITKRTATVAGTERQLTALQSTLATVGAGITLQPL